MTSILPCGFVLSGPLKEHLEHYRTCADRECRKRIEDWQRLRALLADDASAKEKTVTTPARYPRSVDAVAVVANVKCWYCGQARGQPCVGPRFSSDRKPRSPHSQRVWDWVLAGKPGRSGARP